MNSNPQPSATVAPPVRKRTPPVARSVPKWENGCEVYAKESSKAQGEERAKFLLGRTYRAPNGQVDCWVMKGGVFQFAGTVPTLPDALIGPFADKSLDARRYIATKHR